MDAKDDKLMSSLTARQRAGLYAKAAWILRPDWAGFVVGTLALVGALSLRWHSGLAYSESSGVSPVLLSAAFAAAVAFLPLALERSRAVKAIKAQMGITRSNGLSLAVCLALAWAMTAPGQFVTYGFLAQGQVEAAYARDSAAVGAAPEGFDPAAFDGSSERWRRRAETVASHGELASTFHCERCVASWISTPGGGVWPGKELVEQRAKSRNSELPRQEAVLLAMLSMFDWTCQLAWMVMKMCASTARRWAVRPWFAKGIQALAPVNRSLAWLRRLPSRIQAAPLEAAARMRAAVLSDPAERALYERRAVENGAGSPTAKGKGSSRL